MYEKIMEVRKAHKEKMQLKKESTKKERTALRESMDQ